MTTRCVHCGQEEGHHALCEKVVNPPRGWEKGGGVKFDTDKPRMDLVDDEAQT